MEAITLRPGSPLAELAAYASRHPEMSIYREDRVWYAWKPSRDGGELAYGHTEDELLAKLDGA